MLRSYSINNFGLYRINGLQSSTEFNRVGFNLFDLASADLDLAFVALDLASADLDLTFVASDLASDDLDLAFADLDFASRTWTWPPLTWT